MLQRQYIQIEMDLGSLQINRLIDSFSLSSKRHCWKIILIEDPEFQINLYGLFTRIIQKQINDYIFVLNHLLPNKNIEWSTHTKLIRSFVSEELVISKNLFQTADLFSERLRCYMEEKELKYEVTKLLLWHVFHSWSDPRW